jgi:hypothetical protein
VTTGYLRVAPELSRSELARGGRPDEIAVSVCVGALGLLIRMA